MNTSENLVKEPVVFRLQLRQHGESFFVSANTDRGAETELVALTPAEIRDLAQRGDQIVNEHLYDRAGIEEAGETLFSTVFRGSILEAFQQARQVADLQGRWLRILVSLPYGTILHEIPWEILRQSGRFIACSATSLVRHLPLTASTPSLACSQPAHMLFSTAEPGDCRQLKLDAEEEAIRQGVAASGGRIRLTVQRRVSLKKLTDIFNAARRSGDPIHIWHHGGHGGILSSEGSRRFVLVLEKKGKSQQVDKKGLAEFLSAEGDLKLAVLSLCFSGTSPGLGVHLAHLGVPAVIGFTGSVENPAAICYARNFYEDVASFPVDLAVARARGAIGVTDDLAWAQAVLYSRASSFWLWSAPNVENSSAPLNQGTSNTFTTKNINKFGNVDTFNQYFGDYIKEK
jgi:hypothetical protein